jgi:hypothetical protein
VALPDDTQHPVAALRAHVLDVGLARSDTRRPFRPSSTARAAWA